MCHDERFVGLSSELRCLLDLDGRSTQLAGPWRETLGWAPEQLLGRRWVELAHPADAVRAREILDRVRRGELIRDVEVRSAGQDGSTHVLRWRAVADPAQSCIVSVACDVTAHAAERGRLVGVPESAPGIVTDLTERRRQDALAEADAQLEEAQRLARLGHWQTDLRSGQRRWSPVVYDIFGVDAATFDPTSSFDDLIHPDDRAAVEAARERVLSDSEVELTHRIVRPDGVVRFVRGIVRLEHDEDGQPERITGTVQDVTDAVSAERALRESRRQLERVLGATNDGWWDVDPVNGTAYYSDRWWEIHGYQPGELPATPTLWRDLAYPDDLDAYDRQLADILRERRTSFSVAGRVVHKQGHLVSITVRGIIDYDEHGRAIRFGGVNTDVTATKQAELAKERFISTVSHELRTPLTSIGGALELIDAGRVGEVPASMAELLAVARRNTRRLGALIDDLLLIDRFTSDQQPFALTVEPLAVLVEQAVVDNEPYATAHGVSYRFVDRSASAHVRVDAARLHQVIVNLLSNAAKFAPTGSVIEVRAICLDDQVRVEVIDTGPGVPAELGARIFERFVQADPSDTRSRGGTGLGLAISREILDRLDGAIGYNSAPGHTCFFFTLPRVAAAQG